MNRKITAGIIISVFLLFSISSIGISKSIQTAGHEFTDTEGFIEKVLNDIKEVFQKIIEFVLRVYRAVDNWLERVIGFGPSDLFRLIRDILVAILEFIIKLIKWVIDLVIKR